MCAELKDFTWLVLLVLLFIVGLLMMCGGAYAVLKDKHNHRGEQCFLAGFFICVLAGVSCLLTP